MIACDAAFAGLHHDIHHAIADGNLVAVNSTMNGRHTAPWAVYTADGAVDRSSRRRTRPSRRPSPTGSGSKTACSSSTGITATISGWPGNLAGSRRPRPTCSRWRARSTALSVLDLRHGEHVALVGFGDRARAALGHAPGHPSMEMPVHVSRSRGGRTFLDAALAMGLSQRRQVSLTLPGRLPRAPASCSYACARPRSPQTEPVFRARR